MYLTGPQIKSYAEALSRAFTPVRFDQLMLGRLDKVRTTISMQPDYTSILYDVVILANHEGWALGLLDAARASNPGNAGLLAFEESLGRGVIPVTNKTNLEQIVDQRSTFADVMSFRERLGRLATWVCAIEMPGGGGSGLLVRPDVVLTNCHVVERIAKGKASPGDVKCRFDFKALPDGSDGNEGTAVTLANQWLIGSSPHSVADTRVGVDDWSRNELDFALIRLAHPAGSEPIGDNAELQAPEREWLRLTKTPPALAQDDVVFVLQHPQDLEAEVIAPQPMQLAAGTVMGFVGNGLRVRHNTRTLPGSSGSPVLDRSLNLAALHHAGEPNSRLDYRGAYNQAIPLTELVRYFEQNGLDEVLES